MSEGEQCKNDSDVILWYWERQKRR